MDSITFFEYFKEEKVCCDYLISKRYKDFKCSNCGGGKYWVIYKRKVINCECGKQTYLTAGTIFHKSRTPLVKWFYAIYLLTCSKKGVSATWLQGQIGVTYKCVFRMLHLIRATMKDKSQELFSGITEVDETYIGGKERFKHYHKKVKQTQGRSTKGKTAVFGMLERGKKVSTYIIPNASRKVLQGIIKGNIMPGSRIITDEWRGYNRMGKKYIHSRVNHSRKEFVVDDAYTNSIENFWSIVRRGIVGVYHHVSKKYLSNYLAEFEFRYNNKQAHMELFDLILKNC